MRRGHANRRPTSKPHPAPHVPPWYIQGRYPVRDNTEIIRKLWAALWPDMTVMAGTGVGGLSPAAGPGRHTPHFCAAGRRA